MKRRFVIGVSGLTKADQDNFVSFLRDRKLGWWKWIDGFWLIVDSGQRVTVDELSDKLNSFENTTRAIVFEIPEDVTWAGFGPTGPSKDMFQWLRTAWKD